MLRNEPKNLVKHKEYIDLLISFGFTHKVLIQDEYVQYNHYHIEEKSKTETACMVSLNPKNVSVSRSFYYTKDDKPLSKDNFTTHSHCYLFDVDFYSIDDLKSLLERIKQIKILKSTNNAMRLW